MDFVVSKVAMTICALVVVSVLGGAFGNGGVFKNTDELDSILEDLANTLERLAWSGCRAEAVWEVPFLSDGDDIEISVRGFTLVAWTDYKKVVQSTECCAHTWTWNGSALNQSSLEELKADALPVLARSGLALEIRTEMVTFENQDRTFAFVSTSA